MDKVMQILDSAGFHADEFLIACGLVIVGSLLLGSIIRFIFGKHSGVNHAVSSAIAIMFLYAATIVFHSTGARFQSFVAPLPFISIDGDTLSVFHLPSAHYTVLCSQLLSMVILAFLVNLLDTLLPKGKQFFGWLFYRFITVVLALMLHLLVDYLFTTYLPEGIVIYAPTVLLWLLLIMLAVGALKIVVGLVLSTVSPLIGAVYTFFFATLVGKQLSKAVLTTALLTSVVYALNYFGVAAVSIVAAALLAYVPFLVLLVALWYIVNQLL